MNLYLDNAATSYPKPTEVTNSIINYIENIGANPGRGGYSKALESDRIVFNCRQSLMNFFNFDKIENVIFTSNITHSLNTLLKSIVKPGWHIITSSMEHNSVLRPLQSIKSNMDITIDILECSKTGLIDVDSFKSLIKSNTKLVIMNHASNVTGGIQPLEAIGEICNKNGIYFIIDSAQSSGSIPVDFKALKCNALAFTGHKNLLGPQGIGGFLIDNTLNREATSFIEGGTGSFSESILQPDFLPDKFESGTLNTPAIAGLLAGITYIEKIGLSYIVEKEQYLCKKFMDGVVNMNGITVYGPTDIELKTPVVSLNSSNFDNSELGFILDNEFGIMARSGLHCAPLAHKSIGTFPTGTLRFSFGLFNEDEDIKYTLDSLYTILKRK